VIIVLEKGVASIRDISFTDNSSWIRSRKFRLGARMSRASSIEERVQEAVSNPFLVKDHRGEGNKLFVCALDLARLVFVHES
jgi:hypothetical protein